MNWVRRLVVSRFLWLLVIVGVLGFVANRWIDNHGGVRATVEGWGVWAPVVSVLLASLTTVTPMGGIGVAVLNGALFPFWLAVTLNLTGGVLGAMVMYLVWRRGNHEFDIRSGVARLPLWFRRHAGDNLGFLVLLRFLPWAGGTLADMIAGSHRVPVRRHLLAATLGCLPGSLLYALIGAGAVRL